MTDVKVRQARRSDLEEVLTLWTALLDEQAVLNADVQRAPDAVERWRNDSERWLDDDTRRLYVAEGADGLLGFLHAHLIAPPPIYAHRTEVYIDELYVVPSGRGTGYGEALVNAVRSWAEELGAVGLRLGVLAANAAGRAFWEAQGARIASMTMVIDLDPTSTSDGASTRPIGFTL